VEFHAPRGAEVTVEAELNVKTKVLTVWVDTYTDKKVNSAATGDHKIRPELTVKNGTAGPMLQGPLVVRDKVTKVEIFKGSYNMMPRPVVRPA